MLTLLRKVLPLFRGYYRTLFGIALLMTLIRIGDLCVPLVAAWIIDPASTLAPIDTVQMWIAFAFFFWVMHGNVVPFLCDCVDFRYFGLPARKYLGVAVLKRVLATAPERYREPDGTITDPKILQAKVERGEQVVAELMTTIFRIAIPSIPTGLSIGMLFLYIPELGLLVVIGGILLCAATALLNPRLTSRFNQLQALDNRRRAMHLDIFANLHRSFGNRDEAVRGYDGAFQAVATWGVRSWIEFNCLVLGRGLIVNGVNVLVWLVGIGYLYRGNYSLGYFLMFIAWSARSIEFFNICIQLHKQWMETSPAIRLFCEVLEQARGPAAVRAALPETTPAAASVAAVVSPPGSVGAAG